MKKPPGEDMSRNLTDCYDGFVKDIRALMMDRDPFYTSCFRKMIKDSGANPIRLPSRSLNLNSVCEHIPKAIVLDPLHDVPAVIEDRPDGPDLVGAEEVAYRILPVLIDRHGHRHPAVGIFKPHPQSSSSIVHRQEAPANPEIAVGYGPQSQGFPTSLFGLQLAFTVAPLPICPER